MSSLKKRKLPEQSLELGPMFEYDKVTGKMKPLPLYAIEKDESPADGHSFRSHKRRRIVPAIADMKPLQISLPEEPQQDTSKKKNISRSVRKGLFSVHQPPSYRPSIAKRLNPEHKKVPKNKPNVVEQSLIDLEEVEEELLKNKPSFRSFSFQSPQISHSKSKYGLKNRKSPATSQSKYTGRVPSVIENESEGLSGCKMKKETKATTPKLRVSNADEMELTPYNRPRVFDPSLTKDFVKLEKMCEASDSPVSSITSLMAATKLKSNQKSKKINFSDPTRLSDILKSEEEAFSELKSAHQHCINILTDTMNKQRESFERYEKMHQNNMKEIKTTLSLYESSKEQENIPLLSAKSPARNKTLLPSPKARKRNNLLRSTLEKNLAFKNNVTPKRK